LMNTLTDAFGIDASPRTHITNHSTLGVGRLTSDVRLTVTLYIDEKNPDQEGDLDNYAKTILGELQSNVLRGDKDIGELVVRRIGWRRKDKLTIRIGRESQG
jgi:Holliday junction resolvase RusA-like endonuclease